MAEKISGSGILTKSKIAMQNQWKALTQLKQYLTKHEYNRNLQLVLNKYWIDATQKLIYPSLVNTRNFTAPNRPTDKDNEETIDKKLENIQTAVKVQLPEDKGQTVDTTNLNERKNETQTTTVTTDQFIQNTKDQIFSLPQVLSEFFLKLNSSRGQGNIALTTVPKWKTSVKSNITKHSIASRTKHVLNSIATAESTTSHLRRIEDLLAHVEQYPDARHHALKEGAVMILLRARQRSKDKQVNGN